MELNSLEQSILELVLNYYRSPSQYPELVDIDAPLPQGIDFLLELVAGKVELDTDKLKGDLKGMPVSDLKAAAVFYIEHVFFNSNANFYRTLGLNASATHDQIRHHYGALIHILCLDQDDKAAQWDEAYAMRINRAYSVLRIPDKREKYNKKNNIVVSEFSGVEKRSESRKVLDGDLSETSTEGLASKGNRGSISSSFIATNIDRAYLSKDKKSVNKVAETIAVVKNIDSASPENLYAPNEAINDGNEQEQGKERTEKNKEAAESGAVTASTETVAETKKIEKSNNEPPSRIGFYSLIGVLLLVVMGVAVVYFSGSLQPELEVLESEKTSLEPLEIVETINNISDENIVEFNVDLDKVEEVELVEPKPEPVITKEAEAVLTDQNEMSDLKDTEELLPLAELDVVAKDIEVPSEELGLADESEALAESEQENFENNDATEFLETDDVIEFTDAADEWFDDSMSEEDMLFDSDSLTETDQEIESDETSVEDMNAEKLSAVVRDFVRYYDAGDLEKFIELFAEDAKTDDRENKNGIQEDYADAFNLTVKRKFLIDDVQWVMLDENNGLGTADFVLFIQALGEDRFAEYTGEITFYIENRDDAFLITGLYHQYSE